jgi:hypothetical protein
MLKSIYRAIKGRLPIRRRLRCALWLGALVPLLAGEAAAPGRARGRDDTPKIKPPAFALTYPAGMPTPFTLAYTSWHGLPMTHALVGSQFRGFILDTALNGCALTPQAAQLIHLTPDAGKLDLQVFDQVLSVDRVQMPKLAFNLVSFNNVSFGLVDIAAQLSPIHARQLDAPVGWLGAPFFAAFQTTFYFDRLAAILEKPDAPLPTAKGLVTVPMDLGVDGRVQVLVTLPGAKPFLALLATSAPITVLPADVVTQAKLKPLDVTTAVQPNGEKAQVAHVVLPRLSVGKAMVEEANAVYVTTGSAPAFGPKTAVLGLDFLRHYHVTLNYARRIVAFAPLPKPVLVPAKRPEKSQAENSNEHAVTKRP